jgi:hypothetical protein
MENQENIVTFAVTVEGEFAGYIHLDKRSEALVAAMKSDPKIAYVPNFKF